MRFSIQSRVLTLVGAGVFIAAGVLSLISHSSLLSLGREVQEGHQRLAAMIARDVSRAIADDMRMLAGVAGAEDDQAARAALDSVLHHGRVASAGFLFNPDGSIASCEPAAECGAASDAEVTRLALEAISAQRPLVSNTVLQPDGSIPLVGVMPFRPIDRPAAGAAGVLIDPDDRRLAELLQPPDTRSMLRVELRDSHGQLLAAAGAGRTSAVSGETTAAVDGTPWVVTLSDMGVDPVAPITAFSRRSLWFAPSLAAIVMLLGWGIARSVRQPLVSLTAAAERIAGGNLEQAIPDKAASRGGDEVGRLAIALERMRRALKASIDEIERSNRELERRVDERTRELAAANATLEDRERVRQQLLRKVISAQEDERKRVARELHDETSQTLAALGIGVDVALATCGGAADDATHQRLAEVRRLVDRMHHELHRLIVNLRPSVLDDLGLAAAIAWFAERQLAHSGVAVRCELGDLDLRLPSEIETAIFRAVQESIVNIARHANAESVLIQGSVADGRLVVEIEDDGDGFDPQRIVRSPESLRGVGLLGMRERIEILGGSLEIESDPGGGTRVVMRVPVAEPVTIQAAP